MKSTFGLLALAAAAKMAHAHATVQAIWINGVDQGAGNSASGYIRSPPNNSPLVDVTSADMTCNVNGKNPVAKTLPVKAGDKITFEWHHTDRSPSDDIIASSHRGPIMVYMAPTAKGAAGNGWVKIAEEGYSNGKWAVDNLIANRGKHSIVVPDVPAGDYLFRPEIIALHEGNRLGGAQFYMECVQVKVTSNGANALPAGVSIPGAYKATDPGVHFDIYNSFSSYPMPGPAVWNGASAAGSAPAPTAAPTQKPVVTAAPTTLATLVKPTTTTAAAPAETDSCDGDDDDYETETPAPQASATQAPAPQRPAPQTPSGSVKEWYQCGGINYTGAKNCESGLVCKEWNPYYHQCIKA
ncbi:putative endoglucanase [Aspergillus clavatus NRRL 1]|uniref:AA9 family lytic polysaccharide monooxygenase A n=1 Tax=Aspergillus clavatus (strain ATCC 1007 / CBS 513.65 / DSM 816 / NCTC 3887 / NRRL 1 / QM 1276 / 107) TaxID=344612 RepID=LP9A_ASPCL|nr:endoglucanase, putative [Aspergillus clavatus NRRL 1]A1C4H2.1 RecName: Full=Probable endo-beta-1,4-glucanase D; Short=Endoglucanase D; AltName: Full=Carboxymethylcellulase D; AltName: Full=Cellulase D; Flags: Precursor [Aspergillus clavatus NRRL 1]EAW15312.1 endoglucanase, putative [Aspergillus clavatus NRRL 1]